MKSSISLFRIWRCSFARLILAMTELRSRGRLMSDVAALSPPAGLFLHETDGHIPRASDRTRPWRRQGAPSSTSGNAETRPAPLGAPAAYDGPCPSSGFAFLPRPCRLGSWSCGETFAGQALVGQSLPYHLTG